MSLPRNDPRHGTPNGYSNHGCRCHACGAANTAYVRARRIGGYATDPCPSCGGPKRVIAALCQACWNAEREPPHGTEGQYNKGCGCDECRQAAAAARRARRAATKVPCSHGCGTMVDSTDRRYPEKPYECRSCAARRLRAEQKAKAAA